jgi:uncharacterized protein YcbX
MEFDGRGAVNDRRWMLVDDRGTFVSQRAVPRLALVAPDLTSNGLRVSGPGMPELDVARPGADAEAITAGVWDGECRVLVADDEAHRWFSRFLGGSVRLVYQPDDAVLAMGPQYAGALTEPRCIALTDGAPLLLIGAASLDDLNHRLPKALLMNRFRPNLVVSGADAYAEDTWKRISIGAMRFEITHPCARCVATTVDQTTAEKGDEPLRTLATYRRVGSGVMFGQNATHHAPGRIRVGDMVDVLS